MQRRNQEHDPQRRNGNSLENAQGTGLETEPVLGVVGVGQEGHAGCKAGEIGQATIFNHTGIVFYCRNLGNRFYLTLPAAGVPWPSSRSTSSRDVCRMSFPWTM